MTAATRKASERYLWRVGYTLRLLRSPYGFSPIEAWRESGASYDCHSYFGLTEPMPTPAEALYMDQTNWADL